MLDFFFLNANLPFPTRQWPDEPLKLSSFCLTPKRQQQTPMRGHGFQVIAAWDTLCPLPSPRETCVKGEGQSDLSEIQGQETESCLPPMMVLLFPHRYHQ